MGECLGQLGLEPTPDEYVAKMVGVFREARRVLRDDGTLWVNLGDSYASDIKGQNNNGEGRSTLTSGARPHVRAAYNDGRGRAGRKVEHGLKPKDLVGIPWRVAFALQADGWYLRSDIIWAKPNPMPESVTDRPTKAHEYLFLMSKTARYYYDAEAIAEDSIYAGKEVRTNGNDGMDAGYDGNRTRDGFRRGVTVGDTRNRRTVWTIPTEPYPEAHFATFPTALVEPCIKAGSKEGDTVLDPFAGSGTTLMVACRLNRGAIGLELSPAYVEMARTRIHGDAPLLNRETSNGVSP